MPSLVKQFTCIFVRCFLNENFDIRTSHHNIFVHDTCGVIIKIISLYNLRPSIRLSLIRTQSAQPIIENSRISVLSTERSAYRYPECLAVSYELGARHYHLLILYCNYIVL